MNMTQTRFNRSLRVFGPRINPTPAPKAVQTMGVDELVAMADDTDLYETPRIRPFIRNQRARITNYLAATTNRTIAPATHTTPRDRFTR